ncbi:MAG: alcohol dehydrogenase catalytic domain-containing protein [Vicinamibacterales bacterium]
MTSKVSRRRVLKGAGIAAVGGASALLGGSTLAAQQGAPAIRTNTQAGRRIRAFVKLDRVDIPSMQPVTLRALTGRMVAVRTEAAQTCYSSVGQLLLPSPAAAQNVNVVGHGGVGIVEAIGPEVFAVQVGDRVIVNFHSSCGWCHNCVRSRADQCLNGGGGNTPTGDTADGKPVFSGTSGMTEVMVVSQEKCVPIFTDVSSVELSMFTCVGNAGLGMAMTKCPVEPGSDVVVFGCGPVGLSAIQGARIKGAARIIAVEPIRYRRELALKLGATDVVDPNQYTSRTPTPFRGISGDSYKDALVDHIRDMCRQRTDRAYAGGGRIGPDHVIEAAGGDAYGDVLIRPSEVTGPDPTGMTVLSQVWQLCSRIGTSVSCSIGFPADARVQLPPNEWADSGKHFWGGTCGGTNTRRDVPRYVRLIEAGKLDMKALASRNYPLAETTEAYRVAMNRTVVATIVTPNA